MFEQERRPRRTLAQMAADAVANEDGEIVCPKCECRDFRIYGGHRGASSNSTYHYKSCRHCGWKIITAKTERFVRSVARQEQHNVPDEPKLKIAQ